MLHGKGLNTTFTTVKQKDSHPLPGCAARCLADVQCYYAVLHRNTCYVAHGPILVSDVVDDMSCSIIMRLYNGIDLACIVTVRESYCIVIVRES